jgi:hypothetical protein
MQTSKVIEVDGVFIGAAVRLPESQGWRFVSANERARAADGATAPTLADASLLARRAFMTARRVPEALARADYATMV